MATISDQLAADIHNAFSKYYTDLANQDQIFFGVGDVQITKQDGTTATVRSWNKVIGSVDTAAQRGTVNTFTALQTFSAGINVSVGNINVMNDNSMIILGKNSDLALLKKQGQGGTIAVGSGTPFKIQRASTATVAVSSAMEDIFVIGVDKQTTLPGALSAGGNIDNTSKGKVLTQAIELSMSTPPNNSTKSNDDYVKKFAECFGLATEEKQFATAGYVTTLFMQEHFSGKKIYVLGTASYIKELQSKGLLVTEQAEPDIACILVAYDSELTYEKLIKTCEVLTTRNVPFYATNPDLCCPIDFGFIPDCGSICNMLTSSTGKKPVYLGKPAPEMVELCQKTYGFSKEETIVVGDRLYTDILCGINAGVDTCVVYTGEATPEEVASSSYKPTYAFENIRFFYEALAD